MEDVVTHKTSLICWVAEVVHWLVQTAVLVRPPRPPRPPPCRLLRFPIMAKVV